MIAVVAAPLAAALVAVFVLGTVLAVWSLGCYDRRHGVRP